MPLSVLSGSAVSPISPKETGVRPGGSLLEVKTAEHLEERTTGTQVTREPLSHHSLLTPNMDHLGLGNEGGGELP